MDEDTIEIKRMFVCKEQRGKGLSKKILLELERWAKEMNYNYAVLETSIHFTTARNLYITNGYKTIPNYGSYASLPGSICMKKELYLLHFLYTIINPIFVNSPADINQELPAALS